MSNETTISFRVKRGFKARLQKVARRQNKSVSSYIKERLETDLKEENPSQHFPTETEREIFAQYVGCFRHGHTTEKIDEILYGKP